VASTTPHDLGAPTLPVLWSVALSRLALSIVALVVAVRWHVPFYTVTTYTTSPTTIEAGPEWLSRTAAAVLVVVWAALEATTRLDPAWRQTVRRRRMLGRPPVGPDLATPSLAQVTAVAAGVAAVSAGLLFVAKYLPEYLGGLTYRADAASLGDLGPIVGVQVVTLVLLAAGVLAVGTSAAVGRTLLAAAVAGLSAALVSVTLVVYGGIGFGFGLEHLLGVLLVWVLVMLAVGGLAATPVWHRVRQRLVGPVRRRRRLE